MKLENYHSAAEVRRRFQIGTTTLHRWLKDASINFPRPLMFNGRRYFSIPAIDEWQKAVAAQKIKSGPAQQIEPLTDPIFYYEDLIAALRKRRIDLGMSHMALENASGLQGGYASKLEAPGKSTYARGLGRVSMPLLLGALGCGIVLVDTARAQKQQRIRKHG